MDAASLIVLIALKAPQTSLNCSNVIKFIYLSFKSFGLDISIHIRSVTIDTLKVCSFFP